MPAWWVQPVTDGRARSFVPGMIACAFLVLACPVPIPYAATTVRVGTYANEPLVFRDSQGVHRGVYIDILEHVAGKEGWTLEYVDCAWGDCLRRLQRGGIDLLTAIGYSPDRARQFDFNSEAVVVNWGQVYVRRGSPIKTMLDLSGKRLAVIRGDIYYEDLNSAHEILRLFPEFVELPDYMDALTLLAEGKADAALVPRIFGSYHEKQLSIEKTAIMFSPRELRFAAPKGKGRELLSALDRHLAELKSDKRSVYHRSLNVWVEGVQSIIFPRWLNPVWVIGGLGGAGLLIVGMNLLLRRQVRLRTEALRESLAAQEKTAGELRIAREIQMSFVPRAFPTLPGYEIAGVLQPARAVGGDFYDCFLLDQDHLYFVLGDVSDKGVPAALFMAVTQTLLSASTLAAHSPAAIVARVNQQTALHNDAGMFITVFCGILDIGTGRIMYANAGHNPPLLLRHAGDSEFLASGRSPALGIDEEARYEVYDITLGARDTLFMYTDGVTEAVNGQGEFFSEERLRAELATSRVRSAKDLVAEVLHSVATFSGAAPQADDIAILVLSSSREPRGEGVVRLTLPARLAELPRLAEAVIRLGTERALPAEAVEDLRLALEEVVSNIIRHGCGDEKEHEVSVSLRVASEAIAVEVADDGIPYDPLQHPDPDLTRPLEERQEGGLGIYLVRTLMDEVAYRTEAGRNILTMEKRLKAQGRG
jgi:serine phosphatase RsbU (regulator of sigma subunit)/ABC-type amino acid transport substrate-binding protein/anti-sigma regulatory factor (Ser/Thr protein kinase)